MRGEANAAVPRFARANGVEIVVLEMQAAEIVWNRRCAEPPAFHDHVAALSAGCGSVAFKQLRLRSRDSDRTDNRDLAAIRIEDLGDRLSTFDAREFGGGKRSRRTKEFQGLIARRPVRCKTGADRGCQHRQK